MKTQTLLLEFSRLWMHCTSVDDAVEYLYICGIREFCFDSLHLNVIIVRGEESIIQKCAKGKCEKGKCLLRIAFARILENPSPTLRWQKPYHCCDAMDMAEQWTDYANRLIREIRTEQVNSIIMKLQEAARG